MKIAIFGKSGQVATELQRRVAKDIELTVLGRDAADFLDPETVADAANRVDADVIINAVAYTAVDKAETDVDAARLINAVSVAKLAQIAAARRLPLLHISTDYVFDGRGEAPFRPDDKTGPISAYGQTKLEGEKAVADAGGAHVVLRTSWVFSAHGANFVKTMLRLGADRASLKVVDDQVGGPTPAAAIADALFEIARKMHDGHNGGIYHFTGQPDTSWAGFAREIFDQAGMVVEVSGIPTTDYPTPAQRPLNSRLDCESLFNDFSIARPDWRQGLSDVLKELAKT